MSHRMITHVEPCMGTVFSFRVDTTDLAEEALPSVIGRLHVLDALFSTYRPDSEISRINRGELTIADASPDIRAALDACARFEHLTDGWFSARPDGAALDPSGYVKGWAIQEAADRLSAMGSRNHCVNGGGDVVCAGTPEPGRSWRIGIADPHDRDQLVETVEGAGPLAVATSGGAERGAHVLDPHTGLAAQGLASATIVTTDLVNADVYATAVFAMGPVLAEPVSRSMGASGAARRAPHARERPEPRALAGTTASATS
jgi:thiamine biosynthesis lipoprotein